MGLVERAKNLIARYVECGSYVSMDRNPIDKEALQWLADAAAPSEKDSLAEVERLRAALEGFVDDECHCDESESGKCVQCVARAALKG